MASSSRPRNVVMVTVLGMILSGFGFIGGVALLSSSDGRQGVLLVHALVLMFGGALMFFLWTRFFNGHHMARTVLAVMVVLHVVNALFAAVARPSALTIEILIGFAVLETIVLLLMYAGSETKAFFDRNRSQVPDLSQTPSSAT
jgi:low temperature requirement protein LtrA